MSEAEIEVKKWGNSAGILLPKDILTEEGIEIGDLVKVTVSKQKRIDGFGMFKGLNLPSYQRENEEHEW